MTWEGPNALEEVASPVPAKATTRRKALQSDVEEPSESENVPSSEDEYVAENAQPRAGGKRPTRRLSYSSESESDSSKKPSRNRRPSHQSPGPSNTLKRKAQAAPLPPPAPKKTKTSPESTEDPTRKYCLGKFEDLFRDIFLKYPHVRIKDDGGGSDYVEKKAEELTEEEKEAVLSAARQFANDLEHCVYEIYCDSDKHAGDGYKDRFRTLQFNLSKVDRVVLHKRIVSGKISAKEISTMSSTDLADEETKQSIKIAEQESLEHSILQKSTAPRAKITHKGLQDIEDVNGEIASRRERDREREAEEQERMERERMARLRAAQPRQRTMSVSVPPESSVSQNASWGLPPPVPLQDVHAASADPYASARPSSYENTTEPVEPELSLTDLINIDDDAMAEAAPTSGASAASPAVSAPELSTLNVSSPTIGISPFASRPSLPETPLSASFDLNSIWSSQNTKEEKTLQEPSLPQESRDQPIDPEPIAEADDRDFDMFLEEKEPERPLSPGGLQAAFNATEPAWSGKITMPLDSSIPTETPIVARQMGGRPIEVGSPLWRTLFPADLLRIDGRVPVDKSAQFLLQVRLNPSKELIGVAFTPAPDATDNGFMVFADFLIGKGRHGLVFPWGPRPKDAPGREFYIVPLLSSDPIPEFMELLDNLRLPKVRQTNYMIGIWVLNKGELKPPPEPVTVPPPTISPPVPVVPTISPIPNIPPLANLAPPIAAPQIEPAALAAEVAALTPEQIQLMIRTLQGPGGLSIPIPPAPAPAPAPSIPAAPLVSAPLPQSWGISPLQPPPPPHHNGAPPMYGMYPPLPPNNSDQRRDYSRPGYDRGGPGEYHERRDSRGGHDPGHRGGDRSRGRGRGRGRGGGNELNRPVDSGWPRRRPDGGSHNGNPSPQW
ncbi:uncharacterized protein EV420DRAFT_1506824 [Desarmillaria tabescens]|uniref:TFIIS central domain-containing protein n=1 Tax=Armillaria tabescens TaxID=1929756 RepID=A0AA39NJW3_ARMTA|nr:uncharacterized protein EV420DRAFT_1506824 [Desarmillaria tabescens]KAK0467034.1 hypothetical protein EV420DRAFT_1506824 [Desarmillaria tabescens]